MKKYLAEIFLFVLLTNLCMFAQYRDNNFSLSISGNYTTTSRIYLNPKALEQIVRDINFSENDIYSYSIELRYRVSDGLIIGAGTEYLKKQASQINIIGLPPQLAGVHVQEGYEVFPVEISIYYSLPFSTEDFKFFMGGGLGIYFAKYIRKFDNVSVNTVSQDFAWGIHGRIGMDYMLSDYFSVRAEMKFRDPEITMENKYSAEYFIKDGHRVSLPQDTFSTKINLDGMTFSLGAVIHF